jgi:hypothetical protein
MFLHFFEKKFAGAKMERHNSRHQAPQFFMATAKKLPAIADGPSKPGRQSPSAVFSLPPALACSTPKIYSKGKK